MSTWNLHSVIYANQSTHFVIGRNINSIEGYPASADLIDELLAGGVRAGVLIVSALGALVIRSRSLWFKREYLGAQGFYSM